MEAKGTDPKIELHVHLEGTIRPATLLAIAARNGVALPAQTEAELAELYEFTDFAHFIRVWRMTTACLHTADDFRRVVVDYAAEAAGFGAVYLEGIFSPAEPASRGVGWAEILTGYLEGAIEAYERHGVTVRLTPDLYRSLDPEVAVECARWVARYADRTSAGGGGAGGTSAGGTSVGGGGTGGAGSPGGAGRIIVGLGLGGLETAAPAAAFAEAFAVARDAGLALVPHAGEAGGPESVAEILTYQPARIRHGIRAVEDPAVLAEIADRGLVLDVCPTSNLRTRVVDSLAAHPLPALRAAGVRCTVNTDDPAMFGTDLAREYAVAASLGVSPAEAYAAGLAGALCDDDTRARLREVGERHFGAMFAGT